MSVRAAVLGLALLAAPVEARERARHHDRDSKGGVGAVVAGALLAGGLVALLSAKTRAADAAAVPLTETTPDENDAANACAQAAEEQAWNDGREARVQRFAAIEPRVQGGYKVKGDMLVADAGDGYRMRFSCTVKGLDVRSVTLSI